jgi:RNA polymerase sigma-70 factor (ECF subfamily)
VQPPTPKPRRIVYPAREQAPLRYERLSDPILVKRAKDGDARALEALCERHAPRVEKLAGHLLRDSEDARDAAQESLAKLCARVRQFRGEAQFSTWLHRLVLNTCRDVAERKRSRPWEELVEDRRVSTEPDPQRAAEASELRAELCEELAGLPAREARVVVLKDALGFSFEEISAEAGMPVGTAKCYAHRGRSRLRDRLGEVA